MQQVVVILYQRSGTTYQSHLPRVKNPGRIPLFKNKKPRGGGHKTNVSVPSCNKNKIGYVCVMWYVRVMFIHPWLS